MKICRGLSPKLKRRLEYKLTYLAIINAKQYKYNGDTYFKYTEINFYELKSFSTFLELIEKGIIRVNIKLSFHTSGKYQGELYDKGTTWEIKEEDIEKLFLKIQISNNLIEHK